jgi:hypothetical protein
MIGALRPRRFCCPGSSCGDAHCGGVEFSDLPGRHWQVRVVQLRSHIIFVGLREQATEPQRLFEERHSDVERLLSF